MGVLSNWIVGDLGSIKFLTGAHIIWLSGSEAGGSFFWHTSLRWVVEFPIIWNTNSMTHVSYINHLLCIPFITSIIFICWVKLYRSLCPIAAGLFAVHILYIQFYKQYKKIIQYPLWIKRRAFQFYSDNSHLCFSTLRHTLTFLHHVE
jgi:hypothetical protein